MAYLQQNNQNDPNNPQGGNGQQSGSPVSLTSGGSGLSAGGQQSSGGQAQGNQFSNLQKLMNLNQNAPNTAAKVNQNVQQGQQTQQNNVSQATQGIGQAFNYDPNDTANRVNNNDFSGLKQQLDTTYQGPKAGTVNVGPQNLSQIDQQTAALGSTAGQQQLLAKQYGRSDYTAGQQKLDSFLQSRNGDFQQQAAQARNQGKSLDQNVANQNQALNQKAATTEQQTNQGVNNLRQGLGSTVQGYQTNAQNAADVANQNDAALKTRIADVKNGLANGTTDADTLKNLGFNPDDSTYGVNLGDYVNFNGGAANANNVMDKDTYNRFKNINGLLGNDVSSFDDSQAGTYNKGTIGYDTAGLQKAVADQKGKYDASLSPVEQGKREADAIYTLTQQRDKFMPGSQDWQNVQNQIAKQFPGAVTNGMTQTGWAQANSQTKGEQYAALKKQLDSQYMKKVGVK